MVSSDQRRRQLAREKFERQQQRRAEAAAQDAAAQRVIACGAGRGAGRGRRVRSSPARRRRQGQEATRRRSTARPPRGLRRSASRAARSQCPKSRAMTIDKKAKYTMTLDDQGDITFAMDAAKTPHTVNSFKSLAGQGVLRRHEVPPAHHAGHLRAAVRRPEGRRHGRPGLHDPGREPDRARQAAKDGTVPTRRARWRWPTPVSRTPAAASSSSSTRTAKLPPDVHAVRHDRRRGLKVLEKIAKAGVTGGAATVRPKKTVTIEKAAVTRPDRGMAGPARVRTAARREISVALDADSRRGRFAYVGVAGGRGPPRKLWTMPGGRTPRRHQVEEAL